MTTDDLIVKLTQLSEKYKDDDINIDEINLSSLCQEAIRVIRESDLYVLNMQCTDQCENFGRLDAFAVDRCKSCIRFYDRLDIIKLTDKFEPVKPGNRKDPIERFLESMDIRIGKEVL